MDSEILSNFEALRLVDDQSKQRALFCTNNENVSKNLSSIELPLICCSICRSLK